MLLINYLSIPCSFDDIKESETLIIIICFLFNFFLVNFTLELVLNNPFDNPYFKSFYANSIENLR
jgi:hypothetical protein